MDKSIKDHVSDEPLSDANLEELKQQWTLEQLELSKRVSEVCFPAVFVASYQLGFINLTFIVKVDDLLNGATNLNLFGGLDISFIEGDSINACACYVVIDEDFKVGQECSQQVIQSETCTKVVYQDVSMVKLTVPYIPSFLGFREADIFCGMV